jgi:flagellar basal-body rod protein FlgC
VGIVNLLSSFGVSVSGLSAQRRRLDTIAGNIANAEASRTDGRDVPRRKVAVLGAAGGSRFGRLLDRVRQRGGSLAPARTHSRHLTARSRFHGVDSNDAPKQGVEVLEVAEDDSPLKRVYDPGHPDADESGYVTLPNIEIMTEMVDLLSAQRSYEANATALNAAKGMSKKALEI